MKVDFFLKNILSMVHAPTRAHFNIWCACTSAKHGFVVVFVCVFVWCHKKFFSENIIKSCMFKSVCVPYFFKKINFEKNLTLEIFLTSILIILILIFHILIFHFEYFQLHYLLYCTLSSQTGHMDGIWPSVCFSWFQISWCRGTPGNFFGNLQNWIRNSMNLSPGLLVAWKAPKTGSWDMLW